VAEARTRGVAARDGDARQSCLDEIAGGLTTLECDALLELVRSVRLGGVTIIWIEHVINALRCIATRLAVLHGGGIISSGTPDDVLGDERVREVYLGAQGLVQ
jgi:branched-chain amino acid transport system ATP-binding protein